MPLGSDPTYTSLFLVPEDSIYVTYDLKQCAEIVRHMGRRDVDLVLPEFIHKTRFMGIRISGPIIFDHQVDMNRFQPYILQLVKVFNHKHRPGEPFMHIRFWNKEDQQMFIRLVRSGLKEQQAVEQMEMIGIKAMNKDFTNQEGLINDKKPKVKFPEYHYNRRW